MNNTQHLLVVRLLFIIFMKRQYCEYYQWFSTEEVLNVIYQSWKTNITIDSQFCDEIFWEIECDLHIKLVKLCIKYSKL